jgi:CHAT domain-containing protein
MKNKIISLLACVFFLQISIWSQDWKMYEDSARSAIRDKDSTGILKYFSKARNAYYDSSGSKDSIYIRLSRSFAAYANRFRLFTEAENTYTELIDCIAAFSGRNSLEYVNNNLNLADVCITQGGYPKTEKLLLETILIIPELEGNNQMLLAETYNTTAVMYRQLARYDEAEKYYLLTVDILKQQGNQEIPYAITMNNLGVMYRFIGRFDDSETFMLKAKELKAKSFGADHEEYAITLSTLGLLYKETGRYAESEAHFQDAISIVEKKYGKTNQSYGDLLYNLGDLYNRMGNFDKSESSFLKANEVYRKLFKNNHYRIAHIGSGLGTLYNAIGQYEKALGILQEVKNINREVFGEAHPEYIIACHNLAGTYLSLTNYELAETEVLAAKSAYDKLKSADPLIHQKLNTLLFTVKMYRREYDAAENIALANLAYIDSLYGKNNVYYFQNASNLGGFYQVRENPEKAIYYYQLSLEAGSKTLGENHPKYIQAHSGLANAWWAAGNGMKADINFSFIRENIKHQVKQQFSFQNESEKFQFIQSMRNYTNMQYSFYSGSAVPDSIRIPAMLQLSLYNKTILLESLKNLRRHTLHRQDSTIKNLYTTWITIRQQLAYWLSKPVTDRKGKDTELEMKAGQLEKELTKLSAEFGNLQVQNETGWQQIKNSLKQGEAAIDFLDFQYFAGTNQTDSVMYAAIIIRNDRNYPEFVYLFEKKEMEQVLSGYRGSYEKRIDSTYLLPALYSLVWEPVEKKLDGISRIFFAASGLLNQIGFPALKDKNKNHLLDKYELHQLGNLSVITSFRDEFITGSDHLYLYGGVKFDADTSEMKAAAMPYLHSPQFLLATRGIPPGPDPLPELPYSEEEVESIRQKAAMKNHPVTLRKGSGANEESVKYLDGVSHPSVFHFATHGKFFPDPVKKPNKEIQMGIQIFAESDNPLLRSMILLAGANNYWSGKPVTDIEDGILTAYEISNLDFSNAKLVVLSACESGLGDIRGSDGVYGLQRAFKIAGVQNLVMSLWNVPDNSTSEFMNHFYDSLFSGFSIHVAFRSAQNIMKKKYPDEPHKWAGFILVQ